MRAKRRISKMNEYHQIRMSGPEIKLAREALSTELDLMETVEEVEARDEKTITEADRMVRAERTIAIRELIARLGG